MDKMPRAKKTTRKPVDWSRRAARIRKFRSLPFNNRSQFDEAQKQAIRRLWQRLKFIPVSNIRKVGKKKARALKKAGFQVEEKGAILEHMTGAGNKKISGSRLTIKKSGVVVQSIRERKDYYIPLTGDQRGFFIYDPPGFIGRQAKKLGIKTKRRWVYLVVDGRTWGRMTVSGAALKLQSFRDKNQKAYKKSKVAIKIVTMEDKTSHAKKKKSSKKRKSTRRRS
jgi:hypothetical protein